MLLQSKHAKWHSVTVPILWISTLRLTETVRAKIETQVFWLKMLWPSHCKLQMGFKLKGRKGGWWRLNSPG